MSRKVAIGVIGGGSTASPDGLALAEEVGFLIARADAVLICGGLNGVMEASAKGAKRGGGMTVGVLPTGNKADANPFIDLPIATSMSTARNLIIVRTADAIIAVNGSYGTLSEMAHAFDLGKTVFGLRTWPVEKAGVEAKLYVPVSTPREAVDRALEYARKAMAAETPGPGFKK
ncbi:MAG: TIGR00725 family protein [Methanobacteriota archaeon]|nr:MAG: TIGR00725 family protein [Euryarchaeota archaeon]TLZ81283.1 MAG: TIGR00725 family protein [Euryarchaeota archaeon]